LHRSLPDWAGIETPATCWLFDVPQKESEELDEIEKTVVPNPVYYGIATTATALRLR
jgi:hypothetical protein